MAKAILVMEMPESCVKCPMCRGMEDCCYYCMATNQVIVDITLKKHKCPLKPMPEKKTIVEAPYYGEEWFNLEFNACIDAICRKG